MPSLDDLALTVAAADRTNFGAVARARHVSQSTVSRAVQRVEEAIGRPLFAREGRAVRVLPGAEPDVDALRELVARWQALHTATPERATLALFCTVTASQTIVPELLAAFRRAHPQIALDLRTGPASAAFDALGSGDVDAAIAALPARLPRTLVAAEIATTPLVAVAVADLRVPERTWEGAPLIVPRQGVTRELVDTWRRTALRHGHTLQETDSHEEVVALTALGSGIGIVPALVADASPLRPRLRDLTPPQRLPLMRLGLCARRTDVDAGPLALLWGLVR